MITYLFLLKFIWLSILDSTFLLTRSSKKLFCSRPDFVLFLFIFIIKILFVSQMCNAIIEKKNVMSCEIPRETPWTIHQGMFRGMFWEILLECFGKTSGNASGIALRNVSWNAFGNASRNGDSKDSIFSNIFGECFK